MGLQLPEKRGNTVIPQSRKSRSVSPEAMIQVLGRNPYADGLNVAGEVLGQALKRRNALRKQQEQADLLSKAISTGDMTGLNPETQIDLLKLRDSRYKPDGRGNILDAYTGQFLTYGQLSTEDTNKNKKPTVKTTPRETTMDKEVTKLRVDIAKSRPEISSAVSELERIKALNQNSFSGGVGSKAFAAARATGVGADSEIFKNTADVSNTLKGLVAKTLKATFSGQLSDGERNYLNEVYGAADGMTKEERAIAMVNIQNMLTEKLRSKESALNELTGNTPKEIPDQKVRVRNKQTGQTGTVSMKFFDPNKYERVQ